MDTIYIKASKITPDYLETDLETLLILTVFNVCSTSENPKILLKIVECPVSSNPQFRTYVNQSSYETTTSEKVPDIAHYCIWPVIVVDKTVIAGLCSVSRQIIKSSGNKNVNHLLGFREACLVACSESSIWTKFCEIDTIRCVNDVVQKLVKTQNVVEINCSDFKEMKIDDSTTKKDDDTFIIPADLSRFEYHMAQPVKIHNVYKMAREKNKNKDIKSSVPLKDLNIPHCFSEGPHLTLADALLYACVRILASVFGEPLFQQELPLTFQWYQKMTSLELINLKYEVVNCAAIALDLKRLKIVHENIAKESLYSSDPNRYKPQNRIYTKQNDIESSVELIEQSGIRVVNSGLPFGHEVEFNWGDVPLEVNPEGGSLPKSRSNRKCQQLENLAKATVKICTNKIYTIVDFCSGSGHLGLLLSVLLPKCKVILVENKERSLIRAKERVDKLKLDNVILLQCNLDYFQAKFDVGVSLHACGVATDLVIQNCISNEAHFVSCPCCYGGIHDCYHLAYPRSDGFKEVVSYGNYLHFAHAADQTHEAENVKTKQGYKCMDIVDTDRKLYAEKCGYEVFLGKLEPANCTPKNNLIVGVFK